MEFEGEKKGLQFTASRAKEKEGEEAHAEVVKLITKIAPKWDKMVDFIVDSAFRLGRKVQGKSRQIE